MKYLLLYFLHFNAADTIPAKISNVAITVRDLQDGAPLDSVLVSVGAKRGYTDAKGYISFDSVVKEMNIYASRNGYLAQSKKAKAVVTIRLAKRESNSVAKYNNALYERPFEHFTGSATVVSGADLRKLHAFNFIDALKYYDPSLVVTRNNNYGDDPNVAPQVKIRGAYNFPASATIASHTGTPNTSVQLNPSAGDFIASNIGNPDQPVILLNGAQVALQTVLDIDINRIKRVTILKDAAATAVYGVRGGNGIILIETAQPQRGNMSVTYSGQVQITSPDLSSYNLLSASDKLQLEQKANFYGGNTALYNSRLDRVNRGLNTDWLSIPTRKGVGAKHYLSLEGGDDDINYGLDFSFNDVEGVMKGSSRNNANLGGYISTRIKNLVISNYVSYIKSNAANSPYGSLSDYALQNGYWDPYDSVKGGFAKILEEYTYQGNTVRFYNPAYNGTLSTSSTNDYTRISNLLGMNLNIGHGFRLNGQFSISKQSDEENVFLPPGHTAFAQYTPDEFFKRGWYDQVSSEFLSMEGALNLHYAKKKGLHQFYGSAGISAQETQSESVGIQVIGFTSDKLSDIAFGSAYSTSKPETGKIITRLATGYGNFTYSYDNRYQLEVSGNAAESSQFGKNNPVSSYWAVGASWNLHQEKFFHQNKILNELRLRGSVGTAGNLFYQSYLGKTNYNYYTDKQYIQTGSSAGTRGIGLGAFLTAFANDNLKAPATQKQNFGLDAVLLQNRLFVRAEIYHNKTNDIVLPITSPAATGFLNFNYYDNLGAIENKGYEFDLAYTILRNDKKGINWSVRLNGLHNEDKILSTSSYIDFVNKTNDGSGVDQTRPQPRYLVGQSLTGIWAWDGADKILAGDVSPEWIGSFGTAASVKNISAGIYFNYQLGAEAYNQTLADKVENANLTYNVDARALNYNLPSTPTYVTTRLIEKNDVLECAAISLGYSLPQNIAAKIRSKSLKLGFIGNNLFRSGGMKAERGIYYPVNKLYSFSVTANF